MYHQRAECPLRLDGLAAARNFFAGCLAEANPAEEHLWVAHVDQDARCIHLSRHDGHAGAAELPLRQIVADAAVHGSAGLLLAHNHPSGDATPSLSDKRATRRLTMVGEAMNLAILDHLVLAGRDCVSMREIGYL